VKGQRLMLRIQQNPVSPTCPTEIQHLTVPEGRHITVASGYSTQDTDVLSDTSFEYFDLPSQSAQPPLQLSTQVMVNGIQHAMRRWQRPAIGFWGGTHVFGLRLPSAFAGFYARQSQKVKSVASIIIVVVFVHLLLISAAVTFALAMLPILWFFIPFYTAWFLYSPPSLSQNFGLAFFKNLFIWKLYADYFPVEVYDQEPLDPRRKYILAYHPHGIIAHGAWIAFGADGCGFQHNFPGIENSLRVATALFNFPILREILYFSGCGTVNRHSLEEWLNKPGRAVTIIPGGARESLLATPNTMDIIGRRGFIRLAIRSGADLVPVVCFGENELYDQYHPPPGSLVARVQALFLRFLRYTLPILRRGPFGNLSMLVPKKRPLVIIIGKPIPTEPAPPGINAKDFEEYLFEHYYRDLRFLYNKYKRSRGKYQVTPPPMKIVDHKSRQLPEFATSQQG
jgi:2-acylglycerol O-acyltransferase 2